MKPGVKYAWLILIVMGTLFFWRPCYAQDPAMERVGNHGSIDWVEQKVIAKGIGAPPEKYYGKPQARPLAQRAAITDARRNLLEVIKGVHIDSITSVNNYMVRDDTIVARVQGIVQNSSVDDIQYMSDGTVEVIVSMPLTGQLGETLIQMAAQHPMPAAAALTGQGVEARIQRLEDRVKALEDKLMGMKQITLQQKEMLQLYKRFVTAWTEYFANRPVMIQAGYDSGETLATLKKQVDDQGTRLAALGARLEEMAARLASLETSAVTPAPKVAPAKPKVAEVYSGLVIDARDTNFRPCLKPNIFGKGEVLYPGEYIDMQKAIRNGFVRYYRNIGRAQQSTRVGNLPYTVKAKGTWEGERNLEIDAQAFDTLQSLKEVPDSFLAGCNVVIVF
ncbi:MAG: hypothetical protein KKH68_05350 [Proteobacteria bacterium]|nr:hypothetical protein [Pseudomonadota bacterium]